MPRRSARKTSAVIGKKDENGNPGGDRCDTVPSAAFPLAPSGVALETSIEGNQDGTSAPGGDKRPGELRKSSTIERTEVSSTSSFILALMHVPSNYGYPL